VPGGGAVEMAISVGLHARARAVTGVEAGPFRAVADALEVIPHTLVQNCEWERNPRPYSASRKTCEWRTFVGYRW